MNWETRVQSKVESCQRLKKWFFLLLCQTAIIRMYGWRVKCSNLGKEITVSPTLQCRSSGRGSLGFTLGKVHQLYLTFIYQSLNLIRFLYMYLLITDVIYLIVSQSYISHFKSIYQHIYLSHLVLIHQFYWSQMLSINLSNYFSFWYTPHFVSI